MTLHFGCSLVFDISGTGEAVESSDDVMASCEGISRFLLMVCIDSGLH